MFVLNCPMSAQMLSGVHIILPLQAFHRADQQGANNYGDAITV